MSEYIKKSDVQALISSAGNGAIDKIDNLETVDLVRCEECRYYRMGEDVFMPYCMGPPTVPARVTVPWDYCSLGCRRKNGL